jgi:hypothetical protein
LSQTIGKILVLVHSLEERADHIRFQIERDEYKSADARSETLGQLYALERLALELKAIVLDDATPVKLKVGGKYRTRLGYRAVIYETGKYVDIGTVFVGVYDTYFGIDSNTWFIDGTCVNGNGTDDKGLDIVGEWEGPYAGLAAVSNGEQP